LPVTAAEHGTASENITVLRGPGSAFDSIDSAQDVQGARESGMLREDDVVVPGDSLVVAIQSETVSDAFSNTTGANTIERLLRMRNQTGIEVQISHINANSEREPALLSLEKGRIFELDGTPSTFFILIDTGGDPLVPNPDSAQELGDSDQYAVGLEIQRQNSSTEHQSFETFVFETPKATFESRAETLDLKSDPATLDDYADDLFLKGNTTLVPNATLRVKALSADGSVIDAQTVRTTDQRPTTYNATLTVGDLEPGDEFSLVATHDGEQIESQTVSVIAAETPTATVTKPPTTTATRTPITTHIPTTTTLASTTGTGPGFGLFAALLGFGISVVAIRRVG
jgi:hypothetical protein